MSAAQRNHLHRSFPSKQSVDPIVVSVSLSFSSFRATHLAFGIRVLVAEGAQFARPVTRFFRFLRLRHLRFHDGLCGEEGGNFLLFSDYLSDSWNVRSVRSQFDGDVYDRHHHTRPNLQRPEGDRFPLFPIRWYNP